MALGKLKQSRLGVVRGAVAVAERVGRPIYNTERWKRLSHTMRKVYRACGMCGRSLIGHRSYVDHKIALADGGDPFDMSNLWVLCGCCHARKGVIERRTRAGLSV